MKRIEEIASATLNLESALEEFFEVTRRHGWTWSDIGIRIGDAIYKVTDEHVNPEVILHEKAN